MTDIALTIVKCSSAVPKHSFEWRTLLLFVLLALFSESVRFTNGEHVSHYHQHNFTCVDWKRAPEAAAGNCTRYGRYGALRCYGGINNIATIPEQKVRRLEEIIFCGWPERVFNPLIDLQPFPKIRSLIIEYSNLTEITFDFPEMFYLQTINISWTNLSHINTRAFKRVHDLRVVDLRWNKLVQLDGPLLLPRYFEKLYLAGNPWNCTRNFKWLLIPEKGAMVADRDEIICADKKYKERHMLTVMNYKVMLRSECQSHEDLQNCTCTMHHIIPKTHIPLYTINCSNLEFQAMPNYIPENTTTVYLNDNEITDVLPLRNNPTYRHVVDVHLDNNRIESIDVLEGGYWFEHFRLLSLRGNKLQKMPVYALDNALDDNPNANLLLLSGNPWQCTCIFTMRFREILMKYIEIMRDALNITCTYKHISPMRRANVLAITREDICKPEEEPKIYPLDLLNGVLAFLIVFILSKLAYDYYHYKNYGRVPWIVMKLP
ncbi:PREDICTED: protein singed wings 2 isoform X2 [Rhagoletis zephyria]|uniref:protein singed wings 2 isoform X2 n=1 Tax=Rhagoletis zephyria TaxID=28612 RepID=UPI0008114B06|nr:PREDICTED: protein singed wings 2 isoform X2 [Rhagoletis zephyria]